MLCKQKASRSPLHLQSPRPMYGSIALTALFFFFVQLSFFMQGSEQAQLFPSFPLLLLASWWAGVGLLYGYAWLAQGACWGERLQLTCLLVTLFLAGNYAALLSSRALHGRLSAKRRKQLTRHWLPACQGALIGSLVSLGLPEEVFFALLILHALYLGGLIAIAIVRPRIEGGLALVPIFSFVALVALVHTIARAGLGQQSGLDALGIFMRVTFLFLGTVVSALLTGQAHAKPKPSSWALLLGSVGTLVLLLTLALLLPERYVCVCS